MVNHAMAVRPEQMPMSVNEIKQFISPMATENEAYIFLRFCQAQGLNPFVNDAYLIKYDPKAKASIVIGIQALLKRAESNPAYTGYQAGVVVLRNGEPVELQGSLVYKDSDVLIGGWAEVRRKDWTAPLKVTVNLKEYNKRQAQWTEKPATMIEKVALGQGLRRAFPQEVGRLFERQELETEVGEVEGIVVTAQETTPPQPPQQPSEAQEPAAGQLEPTTAPVSNAMVNAGEAFQYGKDILGYPTRQHMLSVPGVQAAFDAKDYAQMVTLLTAAKPAK